MYKILQITSSFLLFSIVFLLVASPLKAQSACATIENIEYSNVARDNGNTKFECIVTVGQEFAGSEYIACGMSINDEFPTNVCKSDQNFFGWIGNKASIGCEVETPLSTAKRTMVAYDFRPHCGLVTGKQVSIAPDSLPTSVPTPKKTPTPVSSTPANPGMQSGVIPVEPSPYPTPQLTVNTSFTSMRSIFEHVGCKVGVPPRILEAVNLIEFAPAINLPPETIRSSSTPGGVMPNCPHNYCAAVGVMQMTVDKDEREDPTCERCYGPGASCANQWGTYGNTVNKYEDLSNYKSNPCNIQDNVYAAAQKLKNDSRTNKNVCGPNAEKWTQQEVYRATGAYYGNCVTNEGLGYCDEAWRYYNL